MNKSESIKELAAALSKAQSEIKGAVKDSQNPFFKSNYADLESVWQAIRQPLADNNLAVVQPTALTPNGAVVVTVVMHSSGEWISGEYPLLAKDNSPQALGSATSYARRYALASMLGVYQTDDDGNHAQSKTPAPTPSKAPAWDPPAEFQSQSVELASEAQIKRLFAISKAKNVSNDDIKDILKAYGYTSTKEIKWTDYAAIIQDIELAGVK